MPLVAAAVCPHPPLLVPEVAAGAAGERDDLRAACDAALARVFAHEPHALRIIGSGATTREYRYPLRASFRPWGVDVTASLGEPGSTTAALPLSLAVGVWLVRRAAIAGRIRRPTRWYAHTVAADAPAEVCRAVADEARSGYPWALLVMGDGSACRGEKAPGYDDPRAEPFDKTVAQALVTADAAALLDLDPSLAAELRVAGRAPWQVLAAAARDDAAAARDDAAAAGGPSAAARDAAAAAGGAGGPSWHGDLLYDAAPYGVAYFVATWTRARATSVAPPAADPPTVPIMKLTS